MDRLTPIANAPLMRRASVIWALLLILVPSADGHCDASRDRPAYLQEIQQELARLDIAAQCNAATNICRVATDIPHPQSERKLELIVTYSPKTDTIYLCFEALLRIENDGELSRALAVKLLGLNREMVTAKFEWDEASRTVRLSATLNTDTNFDRRAFRSQIKALLQIAKTVGPTLKNAAEL